MNYSRTRNRIAVLSAACIFAVAPIVLGEAIASPRYPVTFQKYSPSIAQDIYESYRLQMNLKEEPDAPMAFEAEHASKIELPGAERLAFMNDAGGGVVVRQAQALYFNFGNLLAPKSNRP